MVDERVREGYGGRWRLGGRERGGGRGGGGRRLVMVMASLLNVTLGNLKREESRGGLGVRALQHADNLMALAETLPSV